MQRWSTKRRLHDAHGLRANKGAYKTGVQIAKFTTSLGIDGTTKTTSEDTDRVHRCLDVSTVFEDRRESTITRTGPRRVLNSTRRRRRSRQVPARTG